MEILRYKKEGEPQYDVYDWIKKNNELDIEIEENFCGFKVLGSPAWEILRDASYLHRGSIDNIAMQVLLFKLREKLWWTDPDKELIEILESLLALYKGDSAWKVII